MKKKRRLLLLIILQRTAVRFIQKRLLLRYQEKSKPKGICETAGVQITGNQATGEDIDSAPGWCCLCRDGWLHRAASKKMRQTMAQHFLWNPVWLIFPAERLQPIRRVKTEVQSALVRRLAELYFSRKCLCKRQYEKRKSSAEPGSGEFNASRECLPLIKIRML